MLMADLAVAVNAGFIKTGAPASITEAKYRLPRIEESFWGKPPVFMVAACWWPWELNGLEQHL